MEPVDILHGTFSLIFVVISFIIGFTIISKYVKLKNRLLLLVGITWILISFPWLPDAIYFILTLFGQPGVEAGPYFIIGNVFLPVALITWIIAYTDMVNKENRKLALGLVLAYTVVFEIVFFVLFFIDMDLIGKIVTTFSADFGVFLIVSYIITILVFLITGLHFAVTSLHLEDRELRLKGKLLRAAFITFSLAAVLEKIARSILLGIAFPDPNNPILLIMLAVVRMLLIISAFEFYGGFLLPRWMKELLIRD
ncbi:MAG: hypothetical protein ACFFBI_03900 [Promethearchaeota archaeon]